MCGIIASVSLSLTQTDFY